MRKKIKLLTQGRTKMEIFHRLFDLGINKIRYIFYRHEFGNIGDNVYISPMAKLEYTQNISIGSNVTIEDYARLRADVYNNPKSAISVGNNTLIHPFAILRTYGGFIKMGHDCTINSFCVLYGHGGLAIGDFVHIATGVTIIPANHGFKHIGIPICKQPENQKGIKIEDDVWIGAKAVILDGVEISKGSIVGGQRSYEGCAGVFDCSWRSCKSYQ